MLIRSCPQVDSTPLPSEITPKTIYLNRRALMQQSLGLGLLGSVGASWSQNNPAPIVAPGKLPALASKRSTLENALATEVPTAYAYASTYNNFYEFGTDKSEPARNAHTFKTRPWTLEIEGLVKKPQRLGLEEVMKLGAMEERIYRMRCVEGWSMVIPWIGFSLSALIKYADPLGSAKYVEFVTLADPKTMPMVGSRVLEWPYTEGLRMDEAMHALTLLTFGMYGEILPNQNGAPIRLNVPWKYGFKNAKSIVKMRFTEKQPATAWNKAAAHEYGFYSNVNPEVDHPRWSQATERRIGEDGLFNKKRKTLMFNGYEAQVASLYAGMDLSKNF
jgi:methionine sulfoxide reductase catalytic subunit